MAALWCLTPLWWRALSERSVCVLDKVGQGWIGVDEMRRICKARAARCGPLNLTPLP